jgi:hypothetical protein
MTQKPLQGKDITPVAQILDGEGMPEAVRVYIPDTTALTEPLYDIINAIPIHWRPIIIYYEKPINWLPILTISQIAPQYPACYLS